MEHEEQLGFLAPSPAEMPAVVGEQISTKNLGISAPYRVLARKYRPQNFDDLIGQEAMVKTLSNAFSTNRIHQAYIFTGVRGVGKTTTARILARALNYETDKINLPTIEMPIIGFHCEAIMESRHVDVIEMDAASNTSIANIREIIEAARYKPVSARTKIYIIDEVHMLSNAAFNGLLKTLEEPPPHVKFLFATTEIRKVPITVLSRCQRFDLRRIEIATMVIYLQKIVEKEGVSAEIEALNLISRASEGSMRDALSLLDQAISHGKGEVKTSEVRSSLGLSDRTRIVALFESLMKGEIANALQDFDMQYNSGADPLAILTDLGEFTHLVTRVKLTPIAAQDSSLSEVEKSKSLEFSNKISIRVLSMAWQIILKGIGEVQQSPRPKIATDMVLVRIAYASELPSPADLVRDFKTNAASIAKNEGNINSNDSSSNNAPSANVRGGDNYSPLKLIQNGGFSSPSLSPSPSTSNQTQPVPQNLRELVALADQRREISIKTALERDVRIVQYQVGKIELILLPQAERDFPNRLAKALLDWTGMRWGVSVVKDETSEKQIPTLHEEEKFEQQEKLSGVQANPAVRAIMRNFPGTEISSISEPQNSESIPASQSSYGGFDDGEENDNNLPYSENIDADL